MNYQKAYKEALAHAREIHRNEEEKRRDMEFIFPELAESKDERIRKALMRFVEAFPYERLENDGVSVKEALAWLEKQSESYTKRDVDDAYIEGMAFAKNELEKQDGHKPVDEPKFKVGDIIEKRHNSDINKFGHFTITDIFENSYWCDDAIICDISEQDEWEIFKLEPDFNFKVGQWIVATGKCTYCITKIDGFNVTLIDVDNNEYVFDVSSLNDAKLWTIQDAKDGDVLASELCDSIILFKGIKDNNIDFYCDYDFSKIDIPGDRFAVNNGQHYGSVEDSKDFHPATKEQRDLLFSKMKESGYEWDAEKKELKIIDWSKHIKCNPNPPSIIKESDWSEEDEKMCQETIDWFEKKCFPYALESENPARESIKWLKSLKGRVLPQPKQEWDEEDEKMFKSLKTLLNNASCYSCTEGVDKILAWLKQKVGE